ncbi:TlpA disulfide reductase family protein [Novosphingobium sp.]|uniref:TlpA family protein disulfide reductase n=1 Tax=Novosphingobium sp. TaxID=1874826 RepID=UPI00333EF9E5
MSDRKRSATRPIGAIRARSALTALAALLLGCSATVAHADPRADSAGLDLAKYRGKVVYVDFWASWCGPCKQAFPFMAQLSRKFRPADLVVITVDEERQRASGEAFLRKLQSTLPVVWDSDNAIGKAWAVNELPVTLMFDRKGKMRFRHQGFVAANTAEYENQIKTLIAEH